ncbi:MAG: FimB/Mfa2 family fimbrial subunit [Alistipes sp.]|jgi:hypothetical protein|nr:FimB/Mfa2 family fimbrial subunit [Alistipes sp.]
MNIYNRVLIFAATGLLASSCLLATSCLRDDVDVGRIGGGDNEVTFVVSVPSAGGRFDSAQTRTGATLDEKGGNGHFKDGVPDHYRDYNAAADFETFGADYGGYADPDSETTAFEGAVRAMAANFAGSPAAKQDTPATDPQTRAIVEGVGNETEDNRIDELCIVLFDRVSGKYVDRISVAAEEITQSVGGDNTLKKFTLTLPDSRYRAIFVANAGGDLETYMSRLGSAVGELTADEFRRGFGFTLPSGGWNAEPGSAGYRPMPMSSQETDFTVPSSRDYETYPIDLTRALAKINVETAAGTVIGSIQIRNYETGLRTMPGEMWRQGMSAHTVDATNSYGTLAGANAFVSYSVAGAGCVDRIFVAEQTALADETRWKNGAFCLLVEIESTPGVVRWYRIDLTKTNADGVSEHTIDLIRNFRYDLRILSVDPGKGFATPGEAYENLPAGIAVDIEAADEGGMNDVTYNGEYQLAVDRSVVILGSEQRSVAHQRVYTDYKNGWRQTAALPSWLEMTPGATALANAETATDIVFGSVQSNDATNASIRKATLVYVAGSLRKEVTVIQLPAAEKVVDNVPTGVNKYAGAFWRADQTGERIIRVERASSGGVMDGKWEAVVLGGADWVVLDAKPSSDGNLGWLDGATPAQVDNGGDAGFDRLHPVTGSASYVSGSLNAGTGEVYFRIGLKNKHIVTDRVPARYATVLVSYGDGVYSQLLYLRQGEDPDYLMRRTDPVSSGGVTRRKAAVKFSPYNLTAETVGAQVNRADDPAGANPARFTDYPSQAGAFFQWMSDNETVRTAWDPVSPSITGWKETPSKAGFWDTWSADNETCPLGYTLSSGEKVDFFRPTDGPTDKMTDPHTAADMEISQMRQSLFRDLDLARPEKMVPGYYADGFFDRRRIVASPTGTANSAVSTDGLDVAYRGVVVANPASGASMFLPSAGYRMRNTPGGDLVGAGETSRYWTSTKALQNPWAVEITYSGLSGIDPTYTVNMGYSVRCIVVPEPEPVLTADNMTFDYWGGTKRPNVVSLDVDGATPVEWEVVGYDTDGDGRFDDANPWLSVDPSYDGDENTKPGVSVEARADGGTLNSDDQKLRSAAVVGSGQNPHDLSTDFAPGLRNTANSYIVNAPGYYMLPLVYGNAIEESKTGVGLPNRKAYHVDDLKPGQLGDFLGYDGAITSPKITGAVDATLVWMDAPGLVDVEAKIVTGGGFDFLHFEVPKAHITQGNALVAVRNAAGAIIWSWHIWVTPADTVDADDLDGNVDEITSANGYKYNLLRTNIGYISGRAAASYGTAPRQMEVKIRQKVADGMTATFTVKQNHGTVYELIEGNTTYQWGRKDPMPVTYWSVNGVHGQEIPHYYGNRPDGQPYEFGKTRNSGITIKDAISNPHRIYGAGNWFGGDGSDKHNLWDATSGGSNGFDSNVEKTVYDPSPAGYKVPRAAAYSGMRPIGNGDLYPGPARTTPIIRLTVAPIRAPFDYYDSDNFIGVYGNSMNWTATPSGDLSRGTMSLMGGGRNNYVFQEPSRSWGGSVRPIEDKAPVAPVRRFVYAAPGVVGIKASDYEALKGGAKRLGDGTYTLTIKGSSTYAAALNSGHEYIENTIAAEFGGLEKEPVYAVYFKWGSMVAMLGEPGDPWSADDAVWVNPEYRQDWNPINSTYGSNNTGAVYFSWSATSGTDNDIYPDPTHRTRGIGDICREFDGGKWRTPGGKSGWHLADGSRPFSGNLADYKTTAVETGEGGNLAFVSADKKIFLPAAGFRNVNGVVDVDGHGESGRYWTSTSSAVNTADGGGGMGAYVLTFESSVNNEHALANSNFGYNVRCVFADEPDVKGVRNVDGVIGYYANGSRKGELTLDGDDGDDANIIYTAMFKWGSLIALGSQDYGDFSGRHVVAAPENFEYGAESGVEAVRKDIDAAGTGANAWSRVGDASGAGVAIAAGSNITTLLGSETYWKRGIGDPCAYYFDHLDRMGDGKSWRMPTSAENTALIADVSTVSRGGNDNPSYAELSVDNPLYVVDSGSNTLVVAPGWRESSTGSLKHVGGTQDKQGTVAYYWSSTAFGLVGTPPNQTLRGYEIYFSFSTSPQIQYKASSFGGSVRCVDSPPAEPEIAGGRNDVLYYKPDGTLEVGRWGRDVTDVAKLAYFKFGGVVGMAGKTHVGWSESTVMFDPTGKVASGNDYADYYNIPKFEGGDLDNSNPYSVTSISADGYHNGANILAGKGDPCRLAGFKTADFAGKSASQVETMLAGAKWSLPSPVDQAVFAGWTVDDPADLSWNGASKDESLFVGTDANGVQGGWYPNGDEGGYFLPTAGVRHSSATGGFENENVEGFYWSGYALNNGGAQAWYLNLTVGGGGAHMGPADGRADFDTATPIRCVTNPTAVPVS